jgi:diacylglycerol kinase (ATP)
LTFDRNNKHRGLVRVWLASKNSFRGIKWLLNNEAAFKQECLLLCIAVPLSYLAADTFALRALLVISIVFILMMEIINTAIEVIIDRISLEMNPLSGVAKDLGSALVTISIIIACAVWLSVILLM